MIHDLHCTLEPRIRQMSTPMNGQTLSPTCAHHIGIEKASNLVHILTARYLGSEAASQHSLVSV